MNNPYARGIGAGVAATIVLSAFMLIKAAFGLLPELNAIRMLADLLNGGMLIGWLAHLGIGIVIWGLLFALLVPMLPGDYVPKGLAFGVVAWLLMMIIVMPMAGAGLFGMNIGIMAPIATLVLHLIFGAVLGYTYGRLSAPPATATPADQP